MVLFNLNEITLIFVVRIDFVYFCSFNTIVIKLTAN